METITQMYSAELLTSAQNTPGWHAIIYILIFIIEMVRPVPITAALIPVELHCANRWVGEGMGGWLRGKIFNPFHLKSFSCQLWELFPYDNRLSASNGTLVEGRGLFKPYYNGISKISLF